MELYFYITVAVFAVGVLKLSYFVWLAARYPEPMLADEVHTVVTEDSWPIRMYRRMPANGQGEPVFLCHALATNHLNYELPIGHSVVDALVEAGYDCWTVDLRGNRNSPPPKGMSRRSAHVEDYLTKDVPAALQHIHETTGFEQVHWIGHSMGGMLFYAYEATFGGENIASATTFGSPIGFKDTRVKNGAIIAWLAANCPPLFSAFVRGAAPFAKILRPQLPGLPLNWDNMHPDLGTQAYYNLLEVPPAGVARDMNGWATRREWKMKNGELDVAAALRQCQTPLLAFFAKKDPFVNLNDAEDFMDNLPIDDKAMVILSKEEGCEKDYNHCDIPFSPNADIEVFAHIVDWLGEHPIGGAKPIPAKRSFRIESAARLAADALGLSESATQSVAEPAVAAPPKRKAKSAAKKPKAKKAAAKPKPKSKAKTAAKKATSKTPAKKKTATKAKTKPKASTKKKAAAKSDTKSKPKRKAAASKKTRANAEKKENSND